MFPRDGNEALDGHDHFRGQGDLFSPSAHARRTDPDTSHAAAASITPDKLTANQNAVMLVFWEYESPMTDVDLVARYEKLRKPMGLPVQSESGLRTRRKELVTRGQLHDTGVRCKLPSGRMAILWDVTL